MHPPVRGSAANEIIDDSACFSSFVICKIIIWNNMLDIMKNILHVMIWCHVNIFCVLQWWCCSSIYECVIQVFVINRYILDILFCCYSIFIIVAKFDSIVIKNSYVLCEIDCAISVNGFILWKDMYCCAFCGCNCSSSIFWEQKKGMGYAVYSLNTWLPTDSCELGG